MKPTTPPQIAEVERLEEAIGELLAGKGPLLQGAVLVCLVGKFLAGHEPAVRTQILKEHIRASIELIDHYEGEMGRPWNPKH